MSPPPQGPAGQLCVLPGGSDAGRSGLLGVPDGTDWVPSWAKGLRFAFSF